MLSRTGSLKCCRLITCLLVAAWLSIGGQLNGQEATTAAPTKAELIKTLETILPLLEAKDYAAASEYVVMPERMKPEDLSGILAANELSLPGIQQLARDARFGKATDLFGAERAQSFADKMGADVGKCYGFNHETEEATGEIIAEWDGKKFKLIRIDDVGKLAGVAAEMKPDVAQPSEPAQPTEEDRTELIKKASLIISELTTTVEKNPNDVASRAKLAMAHYQIGNYPGAWEQLMAAYQVEPEHVGVGRGLDTIVNEFTKQGVFTVGVPPETIQSLLGEPSEKLDLNARKRWRYAHWAIDFAEGGRVGEIIDLRGATEAWFQPTEKISTDLDGQTWVVGFRRKANGVVVVYYFVPGETMSNYTQLVTVERFIDVSGSMEAIGKKLMEDEKKLVPDSRHKVLASEEDSMILAAMIPGKQTASKHQLIRLWKGPTDLHRLTYTVVSEEEPNQETQKKWLEIFQQATLDTVK